MTTAGTLRATSSGKQPRRVGIVGPEADGNQRVLRRGAGRLLAERAAEPIQQHDAPAQLAQNVGQMRGDGKRSAQPQHVDGVRRAQHRDWRASGPCRGCCPAGSPAKPCPRRQSAPAPRADCCVSRKRPSRLQPGDALPVARRYAGHEPRAEHLLHFREPAIAQRAREPHDGRGLHLRALRHLRDRAERHVGRVVQRELGDHPEPVGKARMPARDLGTQGLVGVVLRASLFGCSSVRP